MQKSESSYKYLFSEYGASMFVSILLKWSVSSCLQFSWKSVVFKRGTQGIKEAGQHCDNRTKQYNGIAIVSFPRQTVP